MPFVRVREHRDGEINAFIGRKMLPLLMQRSFSLRGLRGPGARVAVEDLLDDVFQLCREGVFSHEQKDAVLKPIQSFLQEAA
jgi:hypothetical protein